MYSGGTIGNSDEKKILNLGKSFHGSFKELINVY